MPYSTYLDSDIVISRAPTEAETTINLSYEGVVSVTHPAGGVASIRILIGEYQSRVSGRGYTGGRRGSKNSSQFACMVSSLVNAGYRDYEATFSSIE